MTKEEVLEILEHNWTCLKNHAYTDNELDEALEFIIKALEAQSDVLQYLEYTYSGAKMMNDLEVMLRTARAIKAYELDVSKDCEIKEINVHDNNVGKIDITDGDRAVSLNAVIKALNSCFDSEYAIWSVKQLPNVAPNEEEMAIKYIEAYNKGFCHAQAIFQKERPKGHLIMKNRTINNIEYHTGEDVLNDETHTVKELIRYKTDNPYCSECGRRVDDIAQKYCGYCGVRIRKEGDMGD